MLLCFEILNRHNLLLQSVYWVIIFVQLPVKVEHSCAVIVNASNLLTVAMGLENALMAVMRLDVSYHQGWTLINCSHLCT